MTKSRSSLCSLLINRACACCIHKDSEVEDKVDEGEFSAYYKDELAEGGKMKNVTSVGPWGGNKGGEWSFNEDGSEIIKQIVLVHGDGIDSLVFKFEVDGKMRSSSRFGGPGGLHTEKIDIDWPQEYITKICGYYGFMWWSGPIVVRSLTFVTNLKTCGPFGREEGSYFELPAQGGTIVGFHGRCRQFIDAIGIYTKPI